MNVNLLRQSIRSAARADFSRSGGPGGQNVNKVSTRVTLRISMEDIAGLNEEELTRSREILASRITASGELVISASEERSRLINMERAYTRLENLIINAGRLPRLRRPTKPSRAAREERLHSKRCRSRIKSRRRFNSEE